MRTTSTGLLRVDRGAVSTEEHLDAKYLLRSSDPTLSRGHRAGLQATAAGRDDRSLIAALLETVTGGIVHRGTRSKFERMLLRKLRTRPRVFCLDEAQRLNADGIEILRSLHDDPDTQLTLLLVGGNNCWEVFLATDV